MIDTLVLSGGGPSGVAYAGILKALIDYDTFQKDKLKEIITTSVGIIFAILYLLDYNILQIEKLVLEKDLTKLLNIDDIDIDNLLVKYGLFSNEHIGESVSSFIRHKTEKNDLTLKEFYELSNIILTVKVYNVDMGKTEYLNHINTPDIKLTTLSMMTTAIPYLFQPIKYNDNLYVDGGLKGHFPIEACKSDNYLGLNVKGGTCNTKNFSLLDELPIIGFTINLMNERDNNVDPDDKMIFTYYINAGLNFDLSIDERKSMIEKGYNETIEHLKIINN
jgi:predicted acylesterase/phospholipase RssA